MTERPNENLIEWYYDRTIVTIEWHYDRMIERLMIERTNNQTNKNDQTRIRMYKRMIERSNERTKYQGDNFITTGGCFSLLNENDFFTLVSCDHVVGLCMYTIHGYLFLVKHSLDSTPSGFTISNEELFCIFPNSRAIRVYNNEPFALQRSITVKGMKRPYDIVASEDVLYVSERGDKSIHRIQLPEETVSNWSVDGTRLTLSISKNGNVIVASRHPSKIFEYSSDGKFVREIVVDVIGLRHAIQLEGDKFPCRSQTEISLPRLYNRQH